MEQTLREIASAVGTPLVIDNATSKRLFGHYARILVDMDFSRKIFHEIVVEREGYAFPVAVAYEWMPDFCSHCQNIVHNVTVCRRLYPRKEPIKETSAAKEQITLGKKHIQITKAKWVPRTDNPSSIGSSLAFGATQTITPEPVLVEEERERNDELQHDIHVFGHKETETTTASLQIETIQNQGEAILIQEETHDAQEEVVSVRSEATHTVLPTPMVTSHILVLQKNNFSMPLENVFDEIIENNIEGNYMPVLSPVKNTHLDISSIVAPDNAKIDPVLQKDLNFMQTWLAKAAETETPFIEVVSKSQKKKEFTDFTKNFTQNPLSTTIQMNILLEHLRNRQQ